MSLVFPVDPVTGEVKAVDQIIAMAPNLPERYLAHWDDFVFCAVAGEDQKNTDIPLPVWAMLNAHFNKMRGGQR